MPETTYIRMEYDNGDPYHHYARSLPSVGFEILSDDHQYQTVALSEATSTQMILDLERAYLRGKRDGIAAVKAVSLG